MYAPPDDSSMVLSGWKLALLILLLAALFRLWGTFEMNEHIEDEVLHVSDSISVGIYGTTANWGWHHPQLRSLIMYGTIQAFGDNPVGWRSSNVLFGTASVLLLFLIARLLYPGTSVPVLAAALLAFDPHHIYLSRTTFVEIPVTCFFLLYFYLLLEFTVNNRQTLPLAGIAMGFTISTKAYFAFAIPVTVLYALYRLRQSGGLSRRVIFEFSLHLLFLPAAVYLLSYFPWFGRGHTLSEFMRMKIDAVWALQRNISFVNIDFLNAGGKPWEWFTRPLFWGNQRLSGIDEGRFLLQTNNPPFRLLVLPSLLAVALHAWRSRSPEEMLPPVLFICCALLIFAAKRPMFSYAAVALLPCAYLSLGRAVTLLAGAVQRQTFVYTCFLSVAFVWVLYLFPLISARLVPLAPYRPILSMVRYMGNF